MQNSSKCVFILPSRLFVSLLPKIDVTFLFSDAFLSSDSDQHTSKKKKKNFVWLSSL